MSKDTFDLIRKNFVFSNKSLNIKNTFNYRNNKYSIHVKLKYVIRILTQGLTFRNSVQYSRDKLCWNTVYNFFIKLREFNIIGLTYTETVKKYINKKIKSNDENIFITDSTMIPNKLGIDEVSINPQFQKHKTNKISLITDISGIPINAKVTNSNIHDAKILNIQLDDFKKDNPIIFNQNNILLGDSAYDSIPLQNKIIDLNFGRLITPKNKRNTKDENKLKQLKLKESDKLKLNKRIKIEHTNARLKQYKRIHLRYDKYIENYKVFVLLACLDITLKAL